MSSCTSCTGENPKPLCPLRLSDGRFFTDYRPRCPRVAELMGMVGNAGQVQSSYEARLYLQNNAEKLMNMNRQWAVNNMIPCAPCKRSPNDIGTMAGGEQYVVKCDAVTCQRILKNPNGIGDGRAY